MANYTTVDCLCFFDSDIISEINGINISDHFSLIFKFCFMSSRSKHSENKRFLHKNYFDQMCSRCQSWILLGQFGTMYENAEI